MISNSFRKFCLPFLILLFSLSVFGQETSYDIWKGKMEKAKEEKEMGNLYAAQKELEQAFQLAKMTYGFGNDEIKKSAIEQVKETGIELVKVYIENKDYSKAYALGNEGITIANYYYNNGDYVKAIDLGSIAKEMLEKMDNKEGADYGIIIASLADVYMGLGDYQTALPLMTKGLRIIGKNLGKNHPRYGQHLINLSSLYAKMGDYQKALPLAKESLTIADRETDTAERETVKDDGLKLMILANLYSELGNHQKALSISLEALDICENNYGKTHSYYGDLLGRAAIKYSNTGDYKKSLSMSIESLEFTENEFGKDHLKYGIKLGSLSAIYFKKGDYKKALSTLLKAQKIIEDILGNKDPRYAVNLNNLSTLYFETGEYRKALPLLEESLKLKEEIIGKEHHNYGTGLFNLAMLNYKLNDYDKAIPLFLEANNNLLTQIDNVFKFRSEKEKKIFLETILANFDINQSISLIHTDEFSEIDELNLNNQLVLKNLLLNSSKDISARLSTLNYPSYDKKITIYRFLKKQLSNQYSMSVSDRTVSIDSLLDVINTKESELVNLYNSKFHDDINISKNWKLSQNKLDENEIAIEFSHFNLYNSNVDISDRIMYVAYVYKKDWELPKILTLFEEKELQAVFANKTPNELYISDELYNIIWQPLKKYIGNSKTIYYSPSGLLNQISFAAIEEKGLSLLSKYDLIQLSSTGVLAEGKTEPKIASILFIGAIDYEYLDSIEDVADSTQYAYLEITSLKNSEASRSRGESWEFLPGTLKEIEGLQSIFRENGNSFNTLKGDYATETNFKKLSGNSPNILHIATHGYFYENLNIKRHNNMSLSTEEKYRLAEDPLLRSGLILAGANYAWKNGRNPYEKEDGILTAMEISNMDLSNTDIVVLSACETGLGDIDGSEGVYGLQRAFKMAGVNIIVMSLWQVPDEETAEFMNLFYSNWIKTKNVKGAFNQAQRTMQKKYKEEPLKWAAFVLFE